MANPLGRPMKYKHFFRLLKDDQIYSPGSIVHLGIESGFLDNLTDEKERKAAITRMRHAFARFSKSHNFPEGGDGGFVKLPGQSPTPGWTGQRWKNAADTRS